MPPISVVIIDSDTESVNSMVKYIKNLGDHATVEGVATDFEHGFIRAEVIAFPDYITGKGEAGAREVGKLRLEGKEYIVREGDVMHFRFNV